MSGIGFGKCFRQRLGGRRHGAGVVPQMRVVAGLLANQVSNNDGSAVGLGRGLEQLIHPWVVVGAVEDNDLRRRNLPRGARRSLEQMRVLVGIAHDASDCDIVTADLPCNITVEILRCHDTDLAIGGPAGRRRGEDQSQRKQ